MSKHNEYIIQYSGLNLGVHNYDYKIGKAFFEQFEFSEIDNCDFDVALKFEKSASMLVLNFDFSGTVVAQCDRCLEDLELPVTGDFRQVIKISDFEVVDEDDEIMVVSTAEYEVDITQFIYEFAHLSLPSKKVHDEGLCDKEAIEKLESYLIHEEPTGENENKDSEEEIDEENIDPRWKALIDLKDRKN